MSVESRALRNLCEDITRAKGNLDDARMDGKCDRIRAAAKLLDEKLDRLSQLLAEKTPGLASTNNP